MRSLPGAMRGRQAVLRKSRGFATARPAWPGGSLLGLIIRRIFDRAAARLAGQKIAFVVFALKSALECADTGSQEGCTPTAGVLPGVGGKVAVRVQKQTGRSGYLRKPTFTPAILEGGHG